MIRHLNCVVLLFVLFVTSIVLAGDAYDDGWIPLFDGSQESWEQWKPSKENESTFRLEAGAIVCRGPRSHLFYNGPVQNASFKNFEYKVDVKTDPGSNGGLYFHSAWQEGGWPRKGFEVQVNNSYKKDRRKTGSLYGVQDVHIETAVDDVWYTTHIIVKNKRVEIRVDGRLIVDWTEPEKQGGSGRVLDRGTFALQGHDPKSVVHYRNIRVKPLPDDVPSYAVSQDWVSLFDGETLTGWEQKNGTARYVVEDGTIKGTTVEGSPNSFLCSKPYRDFELEFEVLVDDRLNSGVQVRSNSNPEYKKGRVHGYQVEIATNGNAGFIYDEARRGWLSKDRSDPLARAAFKSKEWNHYRVVCVGDRLSTWINHIPVAEVVDGMTGSGFIGLQVHSFKGDSPAWVKWRNLQIKELTPTIKQKIKVAVVTGGHGFERDAFWSVFQEMSSVSAFEAVQKDHSELFEDIDSWDYDVVVFYNMTQKISHKRQENLLALLEWGVGLVPMHHVMAAYQEWPKFSQIIGARYNLKDGDKGKKSSYKHDIDMPITVVDRSHPVTQGLDNFTIHDEGYKGQWHAEDNHILLTCDHEASDSPVAWTRTYKKARICSIQLGHDGKSYQHKSFRRLVEQAIVWASQK